MIPVLQLLISHLLSFEARIWLTTDVGLIKLRLLFILSLDSLSSLLTFAFLKFEEAVRQRAAGIFLIHTTESAGYPWSLLPLPFSLSLSLSLRFVYRWLRTLSTLSSLCLLCLGVSLLTDGSNLTTLNMSIVQSVRVSSLIFLCRLGAYFKLASSVSDSDDHVTIQGWITEAVARRLFQRAGSLFLSTHLSFIHSYCEMWSLGLNYEEMKVAALSREFQPISLKQTCSLNLENSIRTLQSHNVLARLEGIHSLFLLFVSSFFKFKTLKMLLLLLLLFSWSWYWLCLRCVFKHNANVNVKVVHILMK
jgi:hypothetical protein